MGIHLANPWAKSGVILTDMRSVKEKQLDFLWGNTEMTHRIRQFDWSKTTLGPLSKWSPSLKNVVGLMLANRFPMILWWGEDYI